ncbi:MAG: ester cyclase [Dehalococcoidia bacterium]|jgi:predicted ester cyclase
MSTEEDNKAMVRHAVELWNKRDLDGFFLMLAPEYVEHLPTGDVSKEQLAKYAHTFFTAFPDIRFKIKELIAEKNKVAVLINWKATHQGEYLGITATNKKIDISVAIIVRIEGGNWVEFWNVTDMQLLQQLGTVPKGKAYPLK